MTPAQRKMIIAYLIEGNTIEDLAEMVIDLTRDPSELLKEAEDADRDLDLYRKDQQS